MWKSIRYHNPRNVFIGGWWDEMEQFVFRDDSSNYVHQLTQFRRFADAAEPYAQEVCRQLVEGLRTKLPRELRDRVYNYLVQGPIDQQFEVSIRDTQTGGLPSKVHSFSVDPTYVGQPVAIEIAELCYRRHIHQTCVDVEQLRHFLQADPFGLSLPVGEYVRKLAICWSKKHRGVRVPKDSEEIVHKSLKWISLLPEAEGVEIQNTIRRSIKPMWNLKGVIGVLERLRPVFDCLKKKQVKMVFVEYFPFGPADYTTYYTSSSFEMWCAHMEQQKATMEREVEERQAQYRVLPVIDEPIYEL